MNSTDSTVILAYLYGNILRIFDCGVVHDSEVHRITHHAEADEGDDEDEKPQQLLGGKDRGEEQEGGQDLDQGHRQVITQHQIECVLQGQEKSSSLKNKTTVSIQSMCYMYYKHVFIVFTINQKKQITIQIRSYFTFFQLRYNLF